MDAAVLNNTPAWTCARSGPSACDWYHGAWPYLRLLDLVSTPSWHAPFFRKGIAERSAHRTDPRLLISGCADYAMYALVYSRLGESARVASLDRCPTPLGGVAQYAKKVGAAVPELLVTDAVEHVRPGFYDIIVSDSFLPRFRTNELRKLLLAWYESLSSAGSVLTTVRLPRTSPDSSHHNGRRLNRWLQVADEARPWWSDLSDLPYEELVRRISVFVANQERKTILDVSTLHSLFREAGFGRSTIAIHNYRGREFAYVEGYRGRN